MRDFWNTLWRFGLDFMCAGRQKALTDNILTSARRVPILALLAAVTLAISCRSIVAQPLDHQAIEFQIPAQPLAAALLAYGVVTGLDPFYNAKFAEGRRSSAVSGTFSASEALNKLLEGTGLIARTTGPGSFTVVPAQRTASHAVAVAKEAQRYYAPYFAAIQDRVLDLLCSRPTAYPIRDRVLFHFWLSPSGIISRAEVLGGADDGEGAPLAAAIRGLVIGAPPADMPQPVTLVVFASSTDAMHCSAPEMRKEHVNPLTHRAADRTERGLP